MDNYKILNINLPISSKLNSETILHLDEMFAYIDPQRLRQHLQTLLFSYLTHEHEFLPEDFSDMAMDLQFLFEFLDGAQGKRE
ncbi:MAG TPA: hypothetical protein VNW06_07135 [Cytophagaceae bacterium]|jgi:hypothetical protein|nr:hypothetical protein [Cytophagaceae bacterium]